MPTYSYECTECGNRFDVVQSFSDDALKTCDKCSGRLRKLFGSVGVVFKGSGFYRTDSRESGKKSTGSTTAPAAAESAGKSGSSGGSESSGSSGSGESKSASGEKSSTAKATAASS